MNFGELNLGSQLLEAISYMGFEEATPVQEKVIPVILNNQDLIACAQTGTGKTAAFVLPVLNKLIGKKDHSTDTLILVPTRELAIQIDQQIQGFSYFVPAQSIAVYGGSSGSSWDSEAHAFMHGADIIIATPGRLLAHMKMGNVRFNKINHLILDEADRMLDMGFIDDIQTIIKHLPEKRQTLLFSATMPPGIRHLAKKILTDPVEVSLAVSKPAEGVDQKVYLVNDKQKDILLKSIIEEKPEYDSIIVFASTKSKIDRIVRALTRNGLPASGISSNLTQDQREEVLRKFKARKIRILVATDVLSRGIDVKDINMVVNYDVPHDAEDYVHRVGRTARVNARGEAVTLVTPDETEKIRRIERLIQNQIPRPEIRFDIGPLPSWDDTVKKERKRRPAGKNKSFNRKKPSSGSKKRDDTKSNRP
ncbi:MAG TPA: DEAD/DEAH box helicase [Bacteroidales bacterium]|nr:DEAD/DEAH box helicase [Bacteroidales bacterium]